MSTFRTPNDYTSAPPWPSLYWPFGPGFDPLNMVADTSHSLYYLQDIWRFTMIWSVLFSLAVYLPAGLWAFMMFAKSRGAIASFIIGGVIGVAIAAVYNGGFFVMSTWIPFLWALIQILIVIIGSYSTITAIL